MKTILTVLLAVITLGGGFYYWYRARLHGVYWLYIIFAFLIWPIAVIIGIYWALEDLSTYYRGKSFLSTKSEDNDSKYSLKE